MSFPAGEPGFVADSVPLGGDGESTLGRRIRETIRIYVHKLTAQRLTHEALRQHTRPPNHKKFHKYDLNTEKDDNNHLYLHYNCGHTVAILRPHATFLQKLKAIFHKAIPGITLASGPCYRCEGWKPDAKYPDQVWQKELERSKQEQAKGKKDSVEIAQAKEIEEKEIMRGVDDGVAEEKKWDSDTEGTLVTDGETEMEKKQNQQQRLGLQIVQEE